MSGQIKISEYRSVGDSVSLAKIDGKTFTVIKSENSDYTEGENTTPGVKLTTQKEYDGCKKFHTTRKTIVEFFRNPEILQRLSQGDVVGPVKCVKPSGKKYFVLEDA